VTWLFPPQLRSTFSACVPESACSTKACVPGSNTSDLPRAFWLTLSGTATRRPLSWPGWKKRAWSPRLFGAAIWSNSIASAWLGMWTASLPASPASRGAWPAPSKASGTSAGSGTPSSKSFAERAHGSWCSRTSPDLFQAAALIQFSERWPKNGSLRNGCLSERPPWAPATSASGSSSWPSARSEDAATGGQWMTPHGFQAGNGPDGNEFSKSVRAWSTPQARLGDNRSPQAKRYGDPARHGGSNLDDQVAALWPTATAEDSENSGSPQRPGLPHAATTWPTPDAQAINDGEEPTTFFARQERQKAKGINGNGMGLPLAMAAKTWPSPMARDYRGGGQSHDAIGRQESDGHAGLGERELFAPCPGDLRWAAIVDRRPDLAPAIEPGLRVLADGLARTLDDSRVDQLRCGGNGVVALQAAVAVVILGRRLMR
jgi:hypothetical protein